LTTKIHLLADALGRPLRSAMPSALKKAAGMKAVIQSKLSRTDAFGTTKRSTASATALSAVSTS
jgi:hypothetical protein